MISQRSQSESSWHEETDEEPESKRREVEPELTPKRKPKAKTPKGYVLGSDYYKEIAGYHKYANIKTPRAARVRPCLSVGNGDYACRQARDDASKPVEGR